MIIGKTSTPNPTAASTSKDQGSRKDDNSTSGMWKKDNYI